MKAVRERASAAMLPGEQLQLVNKVKAKGKAKGVAKAKALPKKEAKGPSRGQAEAKAKASAKKFAKAKSSSRTLESQGQGATPSSRDGAPKRSASSQATPEKPPQPKPAIIRGMKGSHADWLQRHAAVLSELPAAALPQTEKHGELSYTLHAWDGSATLEVLLARRSFYLKKAAPGLSLEGVSRFVSWANHDSVTEAWESACSRIYDTVGKGCPFARGVDVD